MSEVFGKDLAFKFLAILDQKFLSIAKPVDDGVVLFALS
jgi:hypothetical protein